MKPAVGEAIAGLPWLATFGSHLLSGADWSGRIGFHA
jgi:hypothetical protein